LESLGNKLKTTRENRNETCDEVSFKINVASRYLKALEAEDFSVFPGEVYTLGLMKNYGEYLGLDPKELIKLYRDKKLQEQPMPLELLKPQRQFQIKPLIKVLGVLVLLAFIGGGFYIVTQNIPKFENSMPKLSRKAKNWMVDSLPMEKRLFVNDSFVVPYEGAEYRLILASVGDTVTVTSDGRDAIALSLGVEKFVDVDNDGFSDIKITALDFVKNKPSTGARLLLEFSDSVIANSENANIAQNDSQTVEFAQEATPSTKGNETQVIIFSSPTPYPFTLQVTFQDYTLFRWEILAERNRQGRNEQYFERNKELSIQAQNGVRIGISNAAAAKIQAIGGGRGVPLELGASGEVVVADIHWIKKEENRYHLVLAFLE
jgi:cytoskeletal protein RodZ